MKLHNSLSQKLEEFKPLNDNVVGLYSCGPTVYSNLHIGNLSAFVYADILRRALTAEGYKVKAVMNITDVDDKTIKNSRLEFADKNPHDALKSLTLKYQDIFINDIERIGIDTNSIVFIKATDTINEMIEMTQILLDKNFAYIADDGVYFSIKNYVESGRQYGVLQKIDRNNEQSRIANDEYDKDSASDFALWKKAEPGEPSWDAKYTQKGIETSMTGRPGWHIECSVMSQKLLGVPFDIHTGGIDLKFPHHENEIAQSLAASGTDKFSSFFVHNNHILIDGRKMSKSLGNVITLREIEERRVDPMAFRLLVVSSHYRNESNFSWDILEAASNRLKNWKAAAARLWQPVNGGVDIDEVEWTEAGIKYYLSQDLNTPGALAYIDSLLGMVEDSGLNINSVESFRIVIDDIKSLLGIDIYVDDIDEGLKNLIRQRELSRTEKNWQHSDEIRDALLTKGVALKDTQNGTVWSKI